MSSLVTLACCDTVWSRIRKWCEIVLRRERMKMMGQLKSYPLAIICRRNHRQEMLHKVKWAGHGCHSVSRPPVAAKARGKEKVGVRYHLVRMTHGVRYYLVRMTNNNTTINQFLGLHPQPRPLIHHCHPVFLSHGLLAHILWTWLLILLKKRGCEIFGLGFTHRKNDTTIKFLPGHQVIHTLSSQPSCVCR